MRKLIVPAILAAMFCTGCSNEALPVEDSQIIQAERISLQFQPVDNTQEVREVSRMDEEEIVKEQGVTGGTIILYSKPGDEDYLYGAYKNKDATYELGVVSGLNKHNLDELLSIDELQLFDRSIVRIKGIFGANAPIQNYFSIVDGGIAPFLCVDTGHAMEVDLDGDGQVEIVSSHGAAIQTYIYKWEDDAFMIAGVNEALGAVSVYLNSEEQIEAYYDDTQTTKRMAYDAGALVPLH